MALTIRTPFCLNEQGKRANNEDSVFPRKGYAQLSDRLFLVCDGVGGSQKGEIASNLLTTYLHDYFTSIQPVAPALVNEQYVVAAIRYAEQKMEAYVKANPNSRGMATTLTLLFLADNSALIAWIGDSRVYYVSPANPQNNFITTDHSLVEQLIASGAITEEEAKDFAQKSTILRAVTGPDPAKADFKVIDNLQPNDYFFLCSDGILESFESKPLQSTFLQSDNTDAYNQRIAEKIAKNCDAKSRDNFSMYLIQIATVDKQTIPADFSTTLNTTPIITQNTTITPVFNDTPPAPPKPEPNTNYRRRALLFLLPILLLITAGTALAYWLKNNNATTTTVINSKPKNNDTLPNPATNRTQGGVNPPPQGGTNTPPQGGIVNSPSKGGGKGEATTDTMKTANNHRNAGEYAKALNECKRILHDTPEYKPAQKLQDTLSNPYFTLIIAGDDLKDKNKYADARAKYDEAQAKYKADKTLAMDKDFEIVMKKWKSADGLLKEANKHSAPTLKPKSSDANPKPKPSDAKPATEKATTTDTSKKGGGK